MVLEFYYALCGLNQDPSRGGINPAISTTNYVGHISVTVVRHDENNTSQYASDIQGDVKNILARGRGRGRRREFHACQVSQSVLTGSK